MLELHWIDSAKPQQSLGGVFIRGHLLLLALLLASLLLLAQRLQLGLLALQFGLAVRHLARVWPSCPRNASVLP